MEEKDHLVCMFNTVGDCKSVSFTVNVYLIDVELSPINGVYVYVCAHVQVLSWVQCVHCVCVCVCACVRVRCASVWVGVNEYKLFKAQWMYGCMIGVWSTKYGCEVLQVCAYQ